jgi:hypothetical protein
LKTAQHWKVEADEHAKKTNTDIFALGLKTLVEGEQPDDNEFGIDKIIKQKTIVSPFKTKMIPPLKPSKDFSVLSLQNITE